MRLQPVIWAVLLCLLVLPDVARDERSCKPFSSDMTDEEIECWNIWREEVGRQAEETLPDCPQIPPLDEEAQKRASQLPPPIPPQWDPGHNRIQTSCMDKELKIGRQRYRKEHPFTRESIARGLKGQDMWPDTPEK